MSVSAIIPAYNEENTIAGVLDILKKVDDIKEIIVVNDGSEDNTAHIAEKCGVRVITLGENMGKGAAIQEGLEECNGEVILLLDADLIGLTVEHVTNLLSPVLNDETDMTLGVFSNGRFSTDFAHMISPHLSGQRAIKKNILDRIENLSDTGYGLEIALTRFVDREGIKVREIELKNLTHVMKEEKYGFVMGLGKRFKMYWQIIKGIRLDRR